MSKELRTVPDAHEDSPKVHRKWFDEIDNDGNGRIDAHELQAAFAGRGLQFSTRQTMRMIRMYDHEHKGALAFDDFCRLRQALKETEEHYNYFAKGSKGPLRIDAVRNALHTAGYKLEKEAFLALFLAFDPERSGKLGLTEYIALYHVLQCCTTACNNFHPSNNGTVTLNFDQGHGEAAAEGARWKLEQQLSNLSK